VSRLRTLVAAFAVLAGAVVAGTGCGHSSTTAAGATTTAAPAPTLGAACTAADVPGGFVADRARAGSIQPAQYSAAGDVQAAMLYDHFQAGYRSVFTNLHPAPGADTDQVVECVELRFASSADAARFLGSYKALRDEAGGLAQAVVPPAASLGTVTVQYAEQGQGFSAYGITSTNVAELATQTGNRVVTVAIAGPTPSTGLAVTLLHDLVAHP